MDVLNLVSGLFKPAAKLIDDLHTSEEEKLDAKARLLEQQTMLTMKVLDYEAQIMGLQGSIVKAEAESKHWLVATWRPITMLTFLGLTVGDSLGWLPNPLRDEAWTLLQLGLGGYVVGRSAEKVMKEAKK